MVEGARLESVITRKGNEGSNPSLSAIFFSFSLSFTHERTGAEWLGELGVDRTRLREKYVHPIRAAARFFCGVPHTHLLGVCCPDHFFCGTA